VGVQLVGVKEDSIGRDPACDPCKLKTNINIVTDAERIATQPFSCWLDFPKRTPPSTQHTSEFFPPLVHKLFEQAALSPDERFHLVTGHVFHGVKQLVQT
jgi:hypothetical protein